MPFKNSRKYHVLNWPTIWKAIIFHPVIPCYSCFVSLSSNFDTRNHQFSWYSIQRDNHIIWMIDKHGSLQSMYASQLWHRPLPVLAIISTKPWIHFITRCRVPLYSINCPFQHRCSQAPNQRHRGRIVNCWTAGDTKKNKCHLPPTMCRAGIAVYFEFLSLISLPDVHRAATSGMICYT